VLRPVRGMDRMGLLGFLVQQNRVLESRFGDRTDDHLSVMILEIE
jgi:hypothetical protein